MAGGGGRLSALSSVPCLRFVHAERNCSWRSSTTAVVVRMVICWLGTRAVYDSSCQLDSSCFAVLIIVIIVISCRYCWLVISPEPGVDHLPCELFVQSVFMDWPTNPLTHNKLLGIYRCGSSRSLPARRIGTFSLPEAALCNALLITGDGHG